MEATASVQLNVRMDKAVRQEGDRALKSKGYTPAEFIRKVWARLAERGKALDDLMQLVDEGPQATGAAGIMADDAITPPGMLTQDSAAPPLCRADELWSEFVQHTGLNPEHTPAAYDELPYKRLLDEAREEVDL